MGKVVLKQVHRGRMTVTQVRLKKAVEATEERSPNGLFGEARRTITPRRPGYLYVEVLVYPTAKEEGEPVGEWEMPIQLRYHLAEAARLAELQTDGGVRR